MIIYHNIALFILVIIIIALVLLLIREKTRHDFWEYAYYGLEKHLSHHQNDTLLELLELTSDIKISFVKDDEIIIEASGYSFKLQHFKDNQEMIFWFDKALQALIDKIKREQKPVSDSQ